MDLQLRDTVTLVSGGTDGLGAALADRLVEEGGRVAVCGRDEGRLEATRDRLRAAGGDVLAVRADVTVTAELAAFVDAAVDRWGRVDGVVNNAGQAAGGRFEDVPEEIWRADLDLKVLGAVRLTRLALPHLRESPQAAVLNVLATAAKAAGPSSMPSAASRAAGLAMTKALSKELGPDGVRVNAVLVGIVESGQWRRRAEHTGNSLDDLYQQLAAGVPLGRVGRSDEFADLAAYLLSPRSSYVTGSAINLDGGSSPAI